MEMIDRAILSARDEMDDAQRKLAASTPGTGTHKKHFDRYSVKRYIYFALLDKKTEALKSEMPKM